MARTDRFRQQHNELLAFATELQTLLDANALSKDAAAARNVLGKIMGKLTLHLSAEDRVLYPELTTHPDPHVSKLAQRFSAEMKTTANQVMAYNDRWATPSSIKARPQEFIAETKKVLALLADRIKRENQELYAAADKVQGQVFG